MPSSHSQTEEQCTGIISKFKIQKVTVATHRLEQRTVIISRLKTH